jgi:hypothetical protein
MKFIRNGLFLLLPFACVFQPASGQTDTLNPAYRPFNKYRTLALQEKLFVHTDRNFYMTGENLWFRIFYVDGTLHRPLELSKVAYLEILDSEGKPVLQTKVSLEEGQRNGSFFLPASLNSGHYTVRAYTAWMRNFSPDFFFQQPVSIVNPFKRMGLPLQTDTTALDVQFFPEGGSMVNGLPAKIAFRATDKSGRGVDFSGALLNSGNDTVAQFRPARNGIGQFTLPLASGEYRAVIRQGKQVVTVRLPAVLPQGYTMQVAREGAGQLKVTVRTNSQTPRMSPTVYLLAHTRQAVKATRTTNLQDNQATFLIPVNTLGEGISHLTVLDGEGKPLCERLFFRKPQSLLQIEGKTDKNQYSTREKLNLDLLTRSGSKETPADMSVAVFRLDSVQPSIPPALYSYLWLTSDLKGTVESPEYYVQTDGPEAEEAADNLMLTHGWRRFRWEEVLKKDSLVLSNLPEYGGHIVRGIVTDTRTNKPASGILTYLSSPGKLIRLYGARSNAQGEVQFEMKDFFGSRDIIVQTDTRRDSTYRVEITSPYAEAASGRKLPEFDIAGNLGKTLGDRSVHMQTQSVYFGDRTTRFRTPEVDSLPFYGVPDEQYFLDRYTRFTVMEDVLREYVAGAFARRRRNGYFLSVYDKGHDMAVLENPMVLLDGVPVFDPNKIMAFDPLKVKRLDVMTRNYLLGPIFFSGIISLATYRGDLGGFRLDPRSALLEYDGMQVSREFYSPRYDTPAQAQNRMPDFRNLLYWSPSVRTTAEGRAQADFYTSDLEGTYLGVINGITGDGKAGGSTFRFKVKNVAR